MTQSIGPRPFPPVPAESISPRDAVDGASIVDATEEAQEMQDDFWSIQALRGYADEAGVHAQQHWTCAVEEMTTFNLSRMLGEVRAAIDCKVFAIQCERDARKLEGKSSCIIS